MLYLSYAFTLCFISKYSKALSTKIIPTTDNYIRTGAPKISKKSTALDVLKELNNYKYLAPYVNENSVAVITGESGGIGLCTVHANTGSDCFRNVSFLLTIKKS